MNTLGQKFLSTLRWRFLSPIARGRCTTTLHMFWHLPRHHFMFRGGECRADEAAGLITIRVKSGQYWVVSVIQVPDGYPMEGCGVQLKSHNFPERIARHHVIQVLRLAVTVAQIANRLVERLHGLAALSHSIPTVKMLVSLFSWSLVISMLFRCVNIGLNIALQPECVGIVL